MPEIFLQRLLLTGFPRGVYLPTYTLSRAGYQVASYSLVSLANLSIVPRKEAKMVTKKKAAKKAGGIQAKLKFNPEWIKDPVPPFFKNLDRLAIRELAAAKRDFAARVKDILAKGQR